MVRLLELNNIRIEAAQEEATRLTNDAATGALDAGGIIEWLAKPGRLVGGGQPVQGTVGEAAGVGFPPADDTGDADESALY